MQVSDVLRGFDHVFSRNNETTAKDWLSCHSYLYDSFTFICTGHWQGFERQNSKDVTLGMCRLRPTVTDPAGCSLLDERFHTCRLRKEEEKP